MRVANMHFTIKITEKDINTVDRDVIKEHHLLNDGG